MKIGIISDTHNNIETTQKAIKIFKSKDVGFIIHSGDLSSPQMLKLFKGFKCRFVLGNVDIDVELINEESLRLGFGSVERSSDITLDGKRILVIHGDDVPVFRKAVASGDYDYIIKGHTHFFENYVSNNARIINPGSLCENSELCIVILDMDDDLVERIGIEK